MAGSSKVKSTKPMRGPGSDAALSAKVGGVSNTMFNPPATKPGSKAKGSFPFGKKKGR